MLPDALDAHGIDGDTGGEGGAVVPGACAATGGVLCGGRCVGTQSDGQHCGGCDRPCASVDGATGHCVNGLCRLLCAPGRASCNGLVGDGCEAAPARASISASSVLSPGATDSAIASTCGVGSAAASGPRLPRRAERGATLAPLCEYAR